MSEEGYMVEFIGGPLDGLNPSHPMANYIQIVDGHSEGHYQMFMTDLKYHWILEEQKPGTL